MTYWLGFGERDNASLALYHDDGPEKGTYDVSDKYIGEVIGRYCPTYTTKDIREAANAALRYALSAKRNEDPSLIAVNNGIFDYQTKMLMNFDPEIVFMSKSHVDYVDGAQNPHITMPDVEDWDVESWMESLSDEEGVPNLLWQMVGSVIRPNVRWDKAILMTATSGNNGKGTLCRLMRNICGEGTCTSIPIKDFGKEFMLAPLMSVSAVIIDENDTDSFLSSADAFKSAKGYADRMRRQKAPSLHAIQLVFSMCSIRSDDPVMRVFDRMMEEMFARMVWQMIQEQLRQQREEAERRLYEARRRMWDAEKRQKAAEKAVSDEYDEYPEEAAKTPEKAPERPVESKPKQKPHKVRRTGYEGMLEQYERDKEVGKDAGDYGE